MGYIAEDLIRQIRSQVQEENTKTIDDVAIFDALNRAQDYAYDILAKHYPDPIAYQYPTDVTADSSGRIEIMESSFEDRICRVALVSQNSPIQLERVPFTEMVEFNPNISTSSPSAYAVMGNYIHILPKPAAGTTFRLWYLKDIDPIVASQGRVSSFGTIAGGNVSAYVVLDELGSSLSSTDDYNKYVNIIDAQTGIVKCTMQINAINTNTRQVTFKNSSPSRSSVLNRTISTDLSTSVQVDDYVCLVEGTCVPFFKKPISNFIMQYAICELRRALGYDTQYEEAKLQRLEKQLESTWAGREGTIRVSNKNPIWKRRPFGWRF